MALLKDERGRSAGRRQVTDLSPLEPKVTEHRVYWKRCGSCMKRTYGSYPVEVLRGGS